MSIDFFLYEAEKQEKTAKRCYSATKDLLWCGGSDTKKPEEKFGLHAMQRRGLTDTKRGESKQDTAGFKSERLVDVYKQSIPRVNTPQLVNDVDSHVDEAA